MNPPIFHINHLSHRYGQQLALDDLSLAIRPAELFGFLGPNGSGKTTLFRILSTLIPPAQGQVLLSGLDIVKDRDIIRRRIGVVFQSPSLDKELTARENLLHHGHLYGLQGPELHGRIGELLERFGLGERGDERVGRFSGGMRRRVELAKGLLTHPSVLLMDEPGTGLDPAARIELWRHLREIRERDGVTILLTTHLMDEADRCDRIAILNTGRLAACDAPDALKAAIAADVITLSSDDPPGLADSIRAQFNLEARIIDSEVRIERPNGHELVPRLVEALVGKVKSVSLSKPTLEDVFIHVTGRAFSQQRAAETSP